MKPRSTIAAALMAIAAVMLISPQAQAAPGTTRDRIVTVTSGPVTATGVQGQGLGAVRFFTIPVAIDGRAGPNNYLTGTLTTISIGLPENRDVRAANLIVIDGNESNQLVIGGLSIYPADGTTLAPGTKTVRPIVGGSGNYNGARGYVVSTNRGADGWTHVFHLKR